MKKSNFMSGAFVLAVGGFLSKLFSAVYRIFLTRILGGEGIGLYQLIFPFYSLCVVLATSGLPLAISKVVSKNKGNEASVIKKCFLFVSIVALILTFVLLISSKGLATLQGQKELSTCYIILAPTIILVSISSVLRGYFQGKHNFVPSAVSNIVEQFVKMCVGLILSLSLIRVSLFAGIIGAVVGIVVSEILSLVILLLYIKKSKLNGQKELNISLRNIVKDVLPITLTNIILPISTFVDSILVVNLLSFNFTQDVSVFLYGLESGAVSSIIGLPTIFSFAIASVILPSLTSVKHAENKNFRLSLAIKIILLITIPCVVCFLLVPNRLINVLYCGKLNAFGLNGAKIAATLLSVSSIGVIFLALNQIFSSSLQAIEQRFVTIKNLTIAVVLKFVVELMFMPSKVLNIYALAVANTVCYVTVMVLNLLEIKQHFKIKIDYEFVGKLIVANCVMLLSLIAIMMINNSIINTILAVLFAMIIYLFGLFKLDIFSKKDKAMIKYRV